MKKGQITLDSWAGGMAPYPDRGPRGSFAYGRNLNIRNELGTMTNNQELVKDTSSVITDLAELLTNGFIGTDGQLYAFGDNNGVYVRSTAKAWTKYTHTAGAIVGSAEFEMRNNGDTAYESHVVGATDTTLYVDQFTASYNIMETIGTFFRGAGKPHRVVSALGVILITDGDHIALMDRERAFNNEALRLPTGITAHDIKENGDIVEIMCTTHTGRAKIFTWDTIQTSWISQRDIQMQGINSADFFESGMLLEGNGELKYHDGANLEPLIRLPGITGPDAHTLKDNLLYMGVWGHAEAGYKGIYSYGRRDRYSPIALNLEHTLSHSSSDAGTIGLVVVHQEELLVAWWNGTGHGLDKLEAGADRDTAFYESLRLDDGKPDTAKFFTTATVMLRPLGDGSQEFSVAYQTNRSNGWQNCMLANGTEDVTEPASGPKTKYIFKIQDKGESIELRITLKGEGGGSGTLNGPNIKSVIIDYNETRAV